MIKEEMLQKKHLTDLANRAYRNNMYTFSDFLSLPEQDLLFSLKAEIEYIPFSLYGGNEACERKIVRFGLKEILGYEEQYPISCIKIEPLIEKFADTFTHRDFLGAIMNLGIERDTVGDIFIEGKTAYVFCHDKIASYICEELSQVKHTHMKCSIVSGENSLHSKEAVEKELLVPSLRIDAVVSKMYNMSRNQSLLLFQAKKIFVNGRIQENNSYFLKSGDSITVRGYGKFDFKEEKYRTKKDKTGITILSYEG